MYFAMVKEEKKASLLLEHSNTSATTGTKESELRSLYLQHFSTLRGIKDKAVISEDPKQREAARGTSTASPQPVGQRSGDEAAQQCPSTTGRGQGAQSPLLSAFPKLLELFALSRPLIKLSPSATKQVSLLRRNGIGEKCPGCLLSADRLVPMGIPFRPLLERYSTTQGCV